MHFSVAVLNFHGMQALDAWLVGHDAGLVLQSPDPDSPHPLLNGRVVAQHPAPGTPVERWAAVTVWIEGGGDGGGVREPRRPLPRHLEATKYFDECG
ncbi:PASTA domain-containing protein [Lentzea kentuckyensis]|uniref:PASTA domain-containing protein n=1 Tax=Lentzea kentuckyensis TaxID=360086 RepID=UPI001B80C740|nr:PASTA domain-containing protein [Lentzea kentuckyensis]